MSKKRILCVEDSPDICELISIILKDYEIISAYSIADALKQAASEHFCLYLLDYHLPDGTGFELTLMLRNFDPETPIIFVTGTSQITDEQVSRIGANSLINKGSRKFAGELKEKVHQLLN